jgi:hypothetical protein
MSLYNTDTLFYLNLLQPLKTRSANLPINYVPLKKIRLSRQTIMNEYKRVHNIQGLSCSPIWEADIDAGKYYYIHIDPYNSSETTLNLLDEVSPLITNPIHFEPECFYNYLITSITGIDKKTNNRVDISKPELCATKVINMYEFGTKHQQILVRMLHRDRELFDELSKTYKKIEYVLYVSGEINCKTDNTIFLNFFSGTYKMKKHISLRRSIYEKSYIVYLFNTIAPNYTNIHFQNNSLISNNVFLTRKELSRLRKHKIPMFLFNTQNECNQMRNHVICYKKNNKVETISDEELKKLYNNIIFSNNN